MEGNVQKMREALLKARLFAGCSPMPFVETAMGGVDRDKLCDEIDAALDVPLRNCDVGTAEEQFERHIKWCKDFSCDEWKHRICRKCFAEWSQMPYDKGGAK